MPLQPTAIQHVPREAEPGGRQGTPSRKGAALGRETGSEGFVPLGGCAPEVGPECIVQIQMHGLKRFVVMIQGGVHTSFIVL